MSRRKRIPVFRKQSSSLPAKKSAALSIRKLAAAVGRSHTTVRGWLKHPDWNLGQGPWPASAVEKVRAWMLVHLGPDPAQSAGTSVIDEAAGTLSKAKLAKIVEQYKSLKFERQRKEGLFHSVGDCDARRTRQIAAVKGELLNVHLRCPYGPDVKVWFESELRRILELFASGGGRA